MVWLCTHWHKPVVSCLLYGMTCGFTAHGQGSPWPLSARVGFMLCNQRPGFHATASRVAQSRGLAHFAASPRLQCSFPSKPVPRQDSEEAEATPTPLACSMHGLLLLSDALHTADHTAGLSRLHGSFLNMLSVLQGNIAEPLTAVVHHVHTYVSAIQQLELPAGWGTQFAACTVHESVWRCTRLSRHPSILVVYRHHIMYHCLLQMARDRRFHLRVRIAARAALKSL